MTAKKSLCPGGGTERESSEAAFMWAAREYFCPVCRAILLGKTRRRRILGSYEYFIRVAAHESAGGRRRTRLGHRIQKAIAKHETPLPADPFEGFRDKLIDGVASGPLVHPTPPPREE